MSKEAALLALDETIREIENLPRFKGQTQMLRELRRIRERSYLR